MICTCQVGFCLRDVSDVATPGLYRRATLVETFKESILNPLYCTFIAKNDILPSTATDNTPDTSAPVKASKSVEKRTKLKKYKRKKDKNPN